MYNHYSCPISKLSSTKQDNMKTTDRNLHVPLFYSYILHLYNCIPITLIMIHVIIIMVTIHYLYTTWNSIIWPSRRSQLQCTLGMQEEQLLLLKPYT